MLRVNNLIGFGAGGQVLGPFRYWRFSVTNHAQASTQRISLYNLRFSEDEGSTTYPPNMTSNSAPSPYVISADSVLNSGFQEWYTFDSSDSTRWTGETNGTQTDWIQVDLGASGEKSFNWMQVKYRGPSVTIGTPEDFDILGSNTGDFTGEETAVHSETGLSAYTEGQVVTYTW